MNHESKSSEDCVKDTLCLICQESLGPHIEAFQKNTSDTEVSETIFRLQCGHAFHTMCLCRSLRHQKGCPTCRDEVPSDRLPRDALDANFVVLSDGTIRLVFDEDELMQEDTTTDVREVLTTALQNSISFVDTLDTVRQCPNVQNARRKMNIEKRKYRSLERKIMEERKQEMNNVLEALRKKYFLEFKKQKQKLKRKLILLRKEEFATMRTKFPDHLDDLTRHLDIVADDYTVEGTVGNHGSFGPLRRSFWHL